MAARLAFLVSGGTGSGKTTLLAALLARVGPGERLVVVEDASELRPDHPHVVALEGRPANVEGAGAVEVRTLVRQALRMRPDRLVVGEVRGAEIVDLLAALNTGHEGGCGTLHANSAIDVPARVEALALAAGLGRDAAHSQLASAVDVVLHLARDADGVRRLRQVAVPARGADGLVSMASALEVSTRRSVPGRARRPGSSRTGSGRRRERGGDRGRLRGAGGGRSWSGHRRAWPRGLAASSRGWVLPAVLGSGSLAAVVAPRVGALLLVLAGAAAAGVALVRRQRRRKAAEAVSARVLETCEVMASELAAGQAPGECLDRAAAAWPPLAPVAAAFRVGADVPAAMRALAAELDGAADLRVVAAAWQVAHRTRRGPGGDDRPGRRVPARRRRHPAGRGR